MNRFLGLVAMLPTCACMQTDPGLITNTDIMAFNAALSIAQLSSQSSILPSTGNATYVGEVGMEISHNASNLEGNVLGDASFDVAFDARTVDGTFSNMVLGDAEGNTSTVDGSLSLDAAIAGGTFAGTLSGAIDMEVSGSKKSVDVDLASFGQFHGGSVASQPGALIGSATGLGTGEAAVSFDSILYYGD